MLGLWLGLTGCILITSHISMARGDKRLSRALLEAIVANLIFGALSAWGTTTRPAEYWWAGKEMPKFT